MRKWYHNLVELFREAIAYPIEAYIRLNRDKKNSYAIELNFKSIIGYDDDYTTWMLMLNIITLEEILEQEEYEEKSNNWGE